MTQAEIACHNFQISYFLLVAYDHDSFRVYFRGLIDGNVLESKDTLYDPLATLNHHTTGVVSSMLNSITHKHSK